jgi:hypothetical protein
MSDDCGTPGVFIRIPAAPPNEGFAMHHGIEVQIDEGTTTGTAPESCDSMTKAAVRPATLRWRPDGARALAKSRNGGRRSATSGSSITMIARLCRFRGERYASL